MDIEKIMHMPVPPKNMKIGLFGGSFNPPHRGHMAVAQEAINKLQLDRIWWMVTPGNPLKNQEDLKPVADRIQESKEFIAKYDSGQASFPIDVVAPEVTLQSHYTIDTIDYLKKIYSDVHFVWVMGADNLAHFHCWHRWKDLLKLIPVIVVDRPGYSDALFESPVASEFGYARVDPVDFKKIPFMSAPAWGVY